jgi:hypothetical protein
MDDLDGHARPTSSVCPSIAVDGGAMRSEDDLTYKLGHY